MNVLQKFWPAFLLVAIGVVALVLIGLDSESGGGGGKVGEIVTKPSGLKYEVIEIGSGEAAKNGDTVTVQYTGRLADTKEVFDTSLKPGSDPFKFVLGQGKVIKGWDEGILGMKVGGKRKLMIPAKLGYGDMGSPPRIPPNADLEFDVELVKIGR